MARPATVSKHLRHELTPQELADLGGKLADQYDELREIDEELNAVKADFKQRTLTTEQEIGRLSRLIKNRFDMRAVECRYEWNAPVDGTVRIVRVDTSDLVIERPMTDDERQEELPLEAATTPETTEAPAETTTAAETVEPITETTERQPEITADAAVAAD